MDKKIVHPERFIDHHPHKADKQKDILKRLRVLSYEIEGLKSKLREYRPYLRIVK